MKPNEAKSTQTPVGLQLTVTAIFFGIILLLFNMCSSGDDKPTAEDLQTAAQIIAQNAVRSQLKSPASAEFPLADVSIITPDTNLFVVRSYVDSQNSFGANLRSDYVVTLKYLGGDKLDDNNWNVQKVNFIQE